MTRGRIWIYGLLFTGCSINYVDRVVLSVSARPLAAAFGLSTVQLGYLFSAFLWSYLVVVLPWGMLVDRVGTRWSTAGGMAFWGLATLLTGASWSFPSLIVSRLLMGVGEGSTYPAGARTIREWIPAGERGLATTVFNCGGYFGPAIGSVAMAAVVSRLGWRGGFYVAGAICFAWLAVWLALFCQPEQARFIGEAERARILAERGGAVSGGGRGAGLAALLRCRSLWGVFVTQGCAVYTVYLFLTWLPSYLQATRHLSVMSSGLLTAVPYAFAVPGTILVGWLSDRLLAGTAVGSGRRRNLVATMMLLSSCILLTPLVTHTAVVLALFSLSLTCIGSTVGLNIALTNDLLVDPANTGRVHGVLVTGGNLFGVLAPIVTGYVIAGTGSYDAAFVIAGVILLAGAVVALTMTRRPIAPGVAPAAAALEGV